MTRIRWEELPEEVRGEISRRTDGLISAEPAAGGSAEIALVLSTESAGRVFVKGTQGARNKIELRVQSFLPDIAPRLLWHAEASGYLLLAFEYTEGRPAVLAPGSRDLPLIALALSGLSRFTCPHLPVLPVEERWAPFADDPSPLLLIGGNNLVHTDLTAENFVIGDQLRIIDWAWPSTGAAWLDTASMVARLIQAGHHPQEAEEWAETVPAWRSAPRPAVTAYAEIRAALARRNGAPIVNAWERYLTWRRASLVTNRPPN